MRRLLAVAAVLVLAAAGCTSGANVRVLGQDELPADLFASPSPTPISVGARDIGLYFVRGDRLSAVVRRAAGTGELTEFALRALLEGPTDEEAAEGLGSAIPDGAELLEVSVQGSVASVDLSKEFEAGAEQNVQLLRLGQVVYTLTGVSPVRRVRFMIDGVPVTVIGQDGASFEEVGRTEYTGLVEAAPPPAAG